MFRVLPAPHHPPVRSRGTPPSPRRPRRTVTVVNRDIEHEFSYHPPTGDEQIRRHETIRAATKDLAHQYDQLPDGREKDLAITALREALLWANAAIACEQPQP